jgi:hypothetical protein
VVFLWVLSRHTAGQITLCVNVTQPHISNLRIWSIQCTFLWKPQFCLRLIEHHIVMLVLYFPTANFISSLSSNLTFRTYVFKCISSPRVLQTLFTIFSFSLSYKYSCDSMHVHIYIITWTAWWVVFGT